MSVPANITQEDAEVAIVVMLSAYQEAPHRNFPADQSTHTLVLANPIGAMLWDAYRTRENLPSKGWFVESWEPGLLELGYQRRLHYLHVSIETSGSSLFLRITDSRNLKQSNGRIHKNAKVWVQLLEADIREALGRAYTAERILAEGH
jgi:hypothetical protein